MNNCPSAQELRIEIFLANEGVKNVILGDYLKDLSAYRESEKFYNNSKHHNQGVSS